MSQTTETPSTSENEVETPPVVTEEITEETEKKEYVDLFVDEQPQYPETLKVHPENYTIYLPSDQYNSAEKMFAAEQAAKSTPKKSPRKRPTKSATT